ncbi:MAG: HlyD family type I secretion periplasmic adaptor subunit, partial [Methyloligellaceae bacterium]
IKDILVREGDIVEAGQTLISLDSTSPNASLRRLVLRRNRQLATQARLRAEAEGRPEISFPNELLEHADDPDVKSIIESERYTFRARRDQLLSEVAILEQGIAAFEERIAGGKAQLKAVNAQLTYIEEELKGKAVLFAKGLMQKPQLLAVQRAQARLTGEVGRLLGDIGDNKERIARARRQIAHVKYQRVEKAVEDLQETESEIRDVRERIRAARDVLKRIDINAPVKGVIVKLKYHTSGGVIEAGNDILEMLPVGEELVIEARVRPQDIDNVKNGQEAIVRLIALSQRVTPMVPGKVVYVSADTLPEDANGKRLDEDIYVARIQLDADEVVAVKDFRPTPGMPAEIYIKTGERTFFEYLIQPIVDSMTRAFRES